jgi:hypothetical protein
MAIDHDQIFKQLIEAFFREFLELFCPDEMQLMDFQQVEFLRDEHFTDVRRGEHRRLDLVARVGLKAGGEKFVLVHTEFEASRKDEDFPRRMFQYFCQLFLRYDTEILPIAMFTDDARWKDLIPDRFELSVANKPVMQFAYHFIKLKHLDYRQYLDSHNPLAYGLMAKMNYNRKERVRLKADFLRLILKCPIDPARRSLLVEFVETYLPLKTREQAEFQQLVESEREYVEVQQMITVYEKQALEKGIQQGIEQGIEQGLLRGKQEALILLLVKKFGKVSATVERKVRRIDSGERLESLLVAALDARTIKDLPI